MQTPTSAPVKEFTPFQRQITESLLKNRCYLCKRGSALSQMLQEDRELVLELINKGCGWTETIRMAVQAGYIDMVEWLFLTSDMSLSELLDIIIKYDQDCILKHMHKVLSQEDNTKLPTQKNFNFVGIAQLAVCYNSSKIQNWLRINNFIDLKEVRINLAL